MFLSLTDLPSRKSRQSDKIFDSLSGFQTCAHHKTEPNRER